MAARKRKANTVPYLEPKKYFHHKLVLNQWLLSRFGIDPLADHRDGRQSVRPWQTLAKTLKNSSNGLSADRHHRYLHSLLGHWQPGWAYGEDQLEKFDANIVAHLDTLNRQRSHKIEWKYFQWLTLLFVEIYLYEFFRDREHLRDSLNQHIARFNAFHQNKGFITGISDYSPEELNKLCLQNATGSGKTLLMHANILQFRHYAKQFGKTEDYGEIVVISPNERLTEQHLQELRESSLYGERLVQGGDLIAAGRKALDTIALTEITKLGEEQGKKIMAVDSFGDANLLLVDEGHRGLGAASDEKGWIAYRNKLAGKGFTFEYSATFKEAVVAAKDRGVETAYAKSILFDYGYRYFYADGYGKDYRIFNLPNDANHTEHKYNYLVAALLAFYQQRALYAERRQPFQAFNLTSPLWVFVGASVVKDDGKKETAQNYKERASDIAEILKFLAWFLGNAGEASHALHTILAGNAKEAGLLDAEGRDIFGSSFPYIKARSIQGMDLYRDICKQVFQSEGGGSLLIERITGDSGELLLKVGDRDTPFGLINVGDAKGLADHLDAMLSKERIANITVEKSEFSSPLFADVVSEKSPITLLLGSRKFIEGWNCWRVSSMGLMNTGKKEGSQIIQLFGRGVRLKGRDMSLMRTSRYQLVSPPQYIHLLETLNVFGIGAEFMAQFRDFLAEEGLPGNENPLVATVKLNVTDELGKRLKILRPKVRKDTNETYSFPKDGPLVLFGGQGNEWHLPPDLLRHNRAVVLDRMPKMAAMVSDDMGYAGVAQAAEVHSHQFDSSRLALLREDQLYLGLLRYTQSRGYANLLLEQSRLKPLLSNHDWYSIRVPGEQWQMNMHNVRLWQEMALELLCLLADRVYNYNRRAYLEPRLEVVTLDMSSGNLPEVDEYTLIVDASESALMDDVLLLQQAFEERNEKEFNNGRESIMGTHLGIHLYNPLLCALSSKIRVQPVGLEESEFQFVQDLKHWLEQNANRLQQTGEELYLLRNLVKKGIGFFEAGGFYPDFILWRIWEEGDKQHQRIVFLDPHGLQHEGSGSEKIEFSQIIKSVQQRMGNVVELESIILSPPKTSRSSIAIRWGLTEHELADKHVFFMADKHNYMNDVMGIVRKVAENR